MDYKIFEGDVRETIKLIPDESVDLIFTSPPYWTIKEYTEKTGEIGAGQCMSSYRISMKEVFTECWRILKPGCYMVVNIGDQFVSATNMRPFHIEPLSSYMLRDMIVAHDHMYLPNSGKLIVNKNKCNYTGTVRWEKVSTTNNSGGGTIMGSSYLPRDAHFLKNNEDIHFVKKGGTSTRPSQERINKSGFTPSFRRKAVRPVWDDIPPAKKSVGHQAPFPIELAERVIRLRSFYGDTVYDPFMGTGTTVAAAWKLGRFGMGAELGWTDGWRDIVRRRIDSVKKHATTIEEGL